MNLYLLLIICVLAVIQNENSRLAALVYAFVCATHTILCDSLEGPQYFLSAAIADALIVVALCFKAKVTRLADILISISLISGAVNASGWLLWELEQPIEIYYYSCMTLYILAIMSMIRKDGRCESVNLVNRVFRWIGAPGYALRSMLHHKAQM